MKANTHKIAKWFLIIMAFLGILNISNNMFNQKANEVRDYGAYGEMDQSKVAYYKQLFEQAEVSTGKYSSQEILELFNLQDKGYPMDSDQNPKVVVYDINILSDMAKYFGYGHYTAKYDIIYENAIATGSIDDFFFDKDYDAADTVFVDYQQRSSITSESLKEMTTFVNVTNLDKIPNCGNNYQINQFGCDIDSENIIDKNSVVINQEDIIALHNAEHEGTYKVRFSSNSGKGYFFVFLTFPELGENGGVSSYTGYKVSTSGYGPYGSHGYSYYPEMTITYDDMKDISLEDIIEKTEINTLQMAHPVLTNSSYDIGPTHSPLYYPTNIVFDNDDVKSLQNIAAPGDYELRFESYTIPSNNGVLTNKYDIGNAKNGSSITIHVVDSIHLNANSIYVNKSEIPSNYQDFLKQAMGASATVNGTDGNISINIDNPTDFANQVEGSYNVEITAQGSDGQIHKISKKVYVLNDEYSISDDRQIAISGHNAIIHKDDAMQVTSPQQLYPRVNLDVREIVSDSDTQANLNDVTMDNANYTKITQGIVGPYNMGVEYKGFKPSKQPILSVVDDDTNTDKPGQNDSDVFLRANNFVINLKDVASLTQDTAKTKAGVKSWNTNLDDLYSKVTANNTQLQAIQQATQIGVYDLTFSVVDNGITVNKDIKVSVIDDYTGVDTPSNPDDSEVFIHANPFTINLKDANALASSKAISNASVKAWNLNGDSLTNVVVDNAQLSAINNATSIGVYDLTFSVTDNNKTANVTIPVSVIDDDTVSNGEIYIDANNFGYELAKASELSDDKIIEQAQAIAWNRQTGEYITDITLSDSDSVRSATEVGPYYVVASTQGASKGFTISLYDQHTTTPDMPNGVEDIYLYANDFSIHANAAKNLDLKKALEEAKVYAWSGADSSDLTEYVGVNVNELNIIKQGNVGVYPLTFTVYGETNTIKVNVYDDTVEPLPWDTSISAVNFTINLSQVANLTSDQAIDKAQAKAWDNKTGDPVDVSVDPTQLAAIQKATSPTVLPLTFSANDASKTINVTVVDDVTYNLEANDFSVHQNVAKKLNLQDSINRSDLKVYDSNNQEQDSLLADVEFANPAQIKEINKGIDGNYPLTFKYKNNTTTIRVNVYGDETGLDDTNNPDNSSIFLDANSPYEIRLSELDNFKANWKLLLQVKAWFYDGTNLNDQVAVNGLDAIDSIGAYTLNLEVSHNGKTATKDVVISVIDDSVVSDGDIRISANNFNYDLENISNLDKDEIIKQGQVKAWNAKTGYTYTEQEITLNPNTLTDVTSTGPKPIKASVDGVTKDFVANIYDEQPLPPEDNPDFSQVFVNAHDFTIYLKDAASLSESVAKTHADADAWNTNGSLLTDKLIVDSEQLKAIQDAKVSGHLPLTFSVTDNGKSASKTINVNIIDEDTGVIDPSKPLDSLLFIDGNNFTININDVKNLTSDSVKDKASVNAWNSDGDDLTKDVVVDEAQLNIIQNTTMIGNYDLTLTVSEDGRVAHKTIIVSVVEDVPAPDNEVFISANDFTVTVSEARGLTEESAQYKAGVVAWNSKGEDLFGRVVTDSLELDAIKSANAGDHFPLSFGVGDEEGNYAGTHINVNVVGDDTGVDTPTDPDDAEVFIRADDIVIKFEDAPSFDANAAISKGNVKAWDKSGNSIDDITVDPTQLTAIQNATSTGAYPLTFSATKDGKTASKQIYVNLYEEMDGNPVEPGDSQVFIDADDFTIYVKDAASLSGAIAKDATHANVKAWSTNGTLLTDKVSVDVNELNAINASKVSGHMPLTFSVTDNGKTASKTINVNIIDEDTGVVDPSKPTDSEVFIDGNNFVVDIDSVKDLTADSTKDKASINAWDSKGNDLTNNVSVDEGQLNTIKNATVTGPYELTFSVNENGQTVDKTIIVSVIDDETGVDNPSSPLGSEVFIEGNNFVINLSDASSLDTAKVITNSQAYAWNKAGNYITNNITANKSELSAINKTTKTGLFPLTLNITDNGKSASKQIYVSVVDENTGTNKPGEEPISGDVFIRANSPLETRLDNLTNFKANFKNETDLFAWAKDGTILTNKVQITGLNNINDIGIYTVTLSVEYKGQIATKDVYVSVINDSVISNENIRIAANNFNYHLDNVGDLDKAGIMSNGGVYAWDINAGTYFTNDEINLNPASLQDVTSVGTYKVVASVDTKTRTNTEKAFYVNIYDDNTDTDDNEDKDNANVFITGTTPIELTISEVNNFKANWQDSVKPHAWANDGTNLDKDIKVSNLDQVKALEGTYTFNISVTYKGMSATKEIEVIVSVDPQDDNNNGNGDGNNTGNENKPSDDNNGSGNNTSDNNQPSNDGNTSNPGNGNSEGNNGSNNTNGNVNSKPSSNNKVNSAPFVSTGNEKVDKVIGYVNTGASTFAILLLAILILCLSVLVVIRKQKHKE